VAGGQVLFNAINVSRSQNRDPSQRPPSFGALALAQMAPACPVEHNLPVGGYLESFTDWFPGSGAFRASHI